MNEQYSHLKSIFGGKLAPHTSGFRSAIGLEATERPDRFRSGKFEKVEKVEERGVPTHWQAELHDRAAVGVCTVYNIMKIMKPGVRLRRRRRSC